MTRKIARKIGGAGGGGERGQFKDIMAVCVTQGERPEIVVADTRILVFELDTGLYKREFGWKTLKEGCRGRYQVVSEIKVVIMIRVIMNVTLCRALQWTGTDCCSPSSQTRSSTKH